MNTHRIVAEAVAIACAKTALRCDDPYDFARWAAQFRAHAAEAAPPYYLGRWT